MYMWEPFMSTITLLAGRVASVVIIHLSDSTSRRFFFSNKNQCQKVYDSLAEASLPNLKWSDSQSSLAVNHEADRSSAV